MRRGGWLILAGVAGLLLAGGYYVTTDRMRGPRWDRLLPDARRKAQQLVAAANQAGLNVMFWEGWRSPEDSARNIAAGTSKVSDPLDSLHVWGAAFDIVFRDAAGLPSWPADTDPRWRKLAQLGQQLGLVSGGLSWGWDWPHFQLPGVSVRALRQGYGDNYLAFLQSQGATVTA